MERPRAIYASIAMVSVFLCVGWVRADESGRLRGEYADKLTEDNDEEIAFYASGLFGKRLMIVPEYAEDGPNGQVACDEIIDLLVADKNRMSEIWAEGFTTIQCGTRDVEQ